MLRSGLQLDKRRLRLVLVVLFFSLAIPTLILAYQAYSQLKWEAFHQARVMAEELAARVDSHLIELIAEEEKRSFADYAFLVLAGDPDAKFLQRSRLSNFPVEGAVPGLLGYFQVDSDGQFSTPLLPASSTDSSRYGISDEEYALRLAVEEKIRSVLTADNLTPRRTSDALSRGPAAAPAEGTRTSGGEEAGPVQALGGSALADHPRSSARADDEVPQQAAFDQLSRDLSEGERAQAHKKVPGKALGRVADLKLESVYEERGSTPQRERQPLAQNMLAQQRRATRKEQSALPERLITTGKVPSVRTDRRDIGINTFESEIDPFDFTLLASGHFVLSRKVWRDKQRYIQGAVIEQRPFVDGLIDAAYRETALSLRSEMVIAYRGDVLRVLSGQAERYTLQSSPELTGALLYQTRLSAPLDGLEFIFSITPLPTGPGGSLIAWVTGIIAVVLSGGFLALYRLGCGQIYLARQQQDFVSAVSHELKTPLTSIRLYGEMLQQGWASEDKKQTYYDYIYKESERLSRLISNVLQLARLTRNTPEFDLRPVKVSELIDMVQSNSASQVQSAGFKLELNCDDETAQTRILVDVDCFAQIAINLIDNAIKFSAKADRKIIEITTILQTDRLVVFSVRDYGPGVPRDQRKQIFTLFYRSESELTRETVGTGIGLALVRQLALAMGAAVDVRDAEPGVEFRVLFPSAAAQ